MPITNFFGWFLTVFVIYQSFGIFLRRQSLTQAHLLVSHNRAQGDYPAFYTVVRMDAEQTIAEIERLERIFAAPDTRPLSAADVSAANRRHDEMLAHSPWFRLWQRYGVCRSDEYQSGFLNFD